MGMWIATPLYVLYYLRTLQATDAWLGILGSVSSLCVIAGFALWRWLIPRLGEALTLKITIVTMGLLPLMVGLSPSLTPILFVVGLNGLLSPGVSLAHLNTLLKVMPETSRTQYYAVYAAICNAGVFVCPLIGVSIANQVGLAPTLIGCGMLAIIGACSFWIWPIREISR
jgi:sugar phosphate permease